MGNPKNYYQNVSALLGELKEAKNQLEKLKAAVQIAARKLGLDTDSIMKLEAEPTEPGEELTDDEKSHYYEEEYKKYLFGDA